MQLLQRFPAAWCSATRHKPGDNLQGPWGCCHERSELCTAPTRPKPAHTVPRSWALGLPAGCSWCSRSKQRPSQPSPGHEVAETALGNHPARGRSYCINCCPAVTNVPAPLCSAQLHLQCQIPAPLPRGGR